MFSIFSFILGRKISSHHERKQFPILHEHSEKCEEPIASKYSVTVIVIAMELVIRFQSEAFLSIQMLLEKA